MVSAPSRDRRPGHDPDGAISVDASLGYLSRCHLTGHPEPPGRTVPGPSDSLVANGVPVHGRVVHRGYLHRGFDVLRQHLSQRLQQRLFLRIQGVKVGHDSLKGLFDAEHVGVAVSVASFHITSFHWAVPPVSGTSTSFKMSLAYP